MLSPEKIIYTKICALENTQPVNSHSENISLTLMLKSCINSVSKVGLLFDFSRVYRSVKAEINIGTGSN